MKGGGRTVIRWSAWVRVSGLLGVAFLKCMLTRHVKFLPVSRFDLGCFNDTEIIGGRIGLLQ